MAPRYISQLAHVEIFSPKMDATVRFLTDVFGLEVSATKGDSIYLRGWGEFFHHSLQVTKSDKPGLGHIAWRAAGEDELKEAAKKLEASGRGIGWDDGGPGHGRAYRYKIPGGHTHEIFWDVERVKSTGDKASVFPNKPQRFNPRGVAARCIDHVTIASKDIMTDVAWVRDTLGHRFMEYTVLDDKPDFVVFAMTTVCERAHDLGLVPDFSGVPGRINHVAFWVDQREDIRRAADVLMDAGTPIEFGPGRHGHGEQDYMYFREPGGLRLELNSGGYRNHEPDWQPIKWTPSQGSNVYYRNIPGPPSMFESFPQAESHPPQHILDARKVAAHVR